MESTRTRSTGIINKASRGRYSLPRSLSGPQREAPVAPELAPPLKLRRNAVGSGEYIFLLEVIDV
jgi:hypothetical protein